MADTVGPAIREKFTRAKRVVLQMDNAPPHVGGGNYDGLEVAMNKNNRLPRIEVMFQPPNSPDLNLNDLGVFHSLQQSYKVMRVRAKLKAAKRLQPSHEASVPGSERAVRAVVRDARRRSDAAPSKSDDSDNSASFAQTPSPTPAARDAEGCRAFHRGESDADMPCIVYRRPGDAPHESGDGSWVRCDARGGWWHVACVKDFNSTTPLPSANSSFVCALCRVGSNAVLFDDSDIVDGQDAWCTVFDVDVPVRYGLDNEDRSVGVCSCVVGGDAVVDIDKNCRKL